MRCGEGERVKGAEGKGEGKGERERGEDWCMVVVIHLTSFFQLVSKLRAAEVSVENLTNQVRV